MYFYRVAICSTRQHQIDLEVSQRTENVSILTVGRIIHTTGRAVYRT